MESDLIAERREAHALIDLLSAEKLSAVHSLLQVMVESVEPLAHSLAKAPYEVEDFRPEVAAELERARQSLRRGEGIPHEEILREFGLDG